MEALICDKEDRLSSRRYKFKDLTSASPSFANIATASSSRPASHSGPKDFSGRYVFPNDAEDIRAHKWFRGIPWDRLHQLQPPFVPRIRSADDTHYFDEEDEVSDWSASGPTEISDGTTPTIRETSHHHATAVSAPPATAPLLPSPLRTDDTPPSNVPPTPTALPLPPLTAQPTPRQARELQAHLFLRTLRRSIQKWALAAIAAPYDPSRIQSQLEALPGLDSAERSLLRQFVRLFGRKDRKRPRDRLLRDRATRGVALDVRRRTAFLGYSWRRIRPLETGEMSGLVGRGAGQEPGQGPGQGQGEMAVMGMTAGVDGMFEPEALRHRFAAGYGYVGGGLDGGGGFAPEEYDYGGYVGGWTGRGVGRQPHWGNDSAIRAAHGKGRVTWR